MVGLIVKLPIKKILFRTFKFRSGDMIDVAAAFFEKKQLF